MKAIWRWAAWNLVSSWQSSFHFFRRATSTYFGTSSDIGAHAKTVLCWQRKLKNCNKWKHWLWEVINKTFASSFHIERHVWMIHRKSKVAYVIWAMFEISVDKTKFSYICSQASHTADVSAGFCITVALSSSSRLRFGLVWTFQSIPFLYKIGWSFQHNFGHPMDLVYLRCTAN